MAACLVHGLKQTGHKAGIWYHGRMAQELCVVVGDEDRARLEAIIGDRNRLLKHVQRARITCSRPIGCRCCKSPSAPG